MYIFFNLQVYFTSLIQDFIFPLQDETTEKHFNKFKDIVEAEKVS